jgi:hypothetical protein
MLRVDTERRFLPRPEGRGLAPSKYQYSIIKEREGRIRNGPPFFVSMFQSVIFSLHGYPGVKMNGATLNKQVVF